MSSERKNEAAGGRLLSRLAPTDFVGRAAALAQVTALAGHGASGRGLLVLSAPSAGASELLRQAYDALFQERGGASPIYFALTRHDRSVVRAARRFLHTFLLQLIAHRRQDASLLHASPSLHDLNDLAAPSDYEWVERLVQAYERGRDHGDERALVRLCLSAPQQAAARGARTLVLFDDVHLADHLSGEAGFGAELARAAASGETPFVLAGLRRRLLDLLSEAEEQTPFDGLATLHLEYLNHSEARTLVERLAGALEVSIKDETRDLLTQQCGGNPFFINALLQAAQASSRGLLSFRACQQLYVDELMGGRIHRRFHTQLEDVSPSVASRRSLIRVLHEAAANIGGKSPLEAWRRRLNLDGAELERMMRGLHVYELASFNSSYIEIGSNLLWREYLEANYRLQVAAEPRALVVAQMLVETLKRAPQTMARHYRRESALKLSELVARFDFQRVPASLLHYDRFARMYKGVGGDEIAAGLDAETDLVRLPQVVHAATGASFHPPLALAADEERCLVAHGFDSTPYTDANEVVWMAAEVESKLEAGRALTEVWCERLLHLAHSCGFRRVRLWLVAPEGFSAEAMAYLNEREAFGSSRQQLELLSARISPAERVEPEALDEFEMVIPMGEDTELIAAHTVEQIARRLDFQPDAINQIKTALVEACINASEHSLSPDRKIYQRFRLENDKLVVTVSSRGVAVSPTASQHSELSNGNDSNGALGRRGWGLKLIRTLMDEVEFERVDDGTRLRMTKYLRK